MQRYLHYWYSLQHDDGGDDVQALYVSACAYEYDEDAYGECVERIHSLHVD